MDRIEIPKDAEWHPLPSEGKNCYLLMLPGRRPIRAFVDPALGIEHLILEILNPKPDPPPPPTEAELKMADVEARIEKLEAELLALSRR